MDHGGEAARPTTVRTLGSTELGAAAAPLGSFTDFDLSAIAGRGVVPLAAEFHLDRQPGPGVAYPNIGEFQRQLGPLDAVLVGPLLPDGVVQVHDGYGYYSVLQPRPGAGRGVVLVDLLHGGGGRGGAVSNWDYTLQPRPGAGSGHVLVDLLPVGGGELSNWDYALLPRPVAGRGEVLVDVLPGDGSEVSNWAYAMQHRPGAGRGEVLVDMLPDGAGHGQLDVDLLPGSVGAAYDNYGHYALHPSPGAGHGDVLVDLLPDGIGVVFDGSGHFARQILPVPGTRGPDGIAGALRGPNLGEGYDNRHVVAKHLRRLLPLAGIAASSVAVNGLAVSPGSPAVAFHLFVLLLAGLFLVILHVLRA